MESIRQSLQRFRQKGKKVIALMTTGGTREYYLASIADRVVLSPVGALDLKGMRVKVMFFKDALAKLGIELSSEPLLIVIPPDAVQHGTAYAFTVSLSNPSDQTITVQRQTLNGSATTADSDYTALAAAPITFNPGQTSKTVTVIPGNQ